jgi:hypothetical protein
MKSVILVIVLAFMVSNLSGCVTMNGDRILMAIGSGLSAAGQVHAQRRALKRYNMTSCHKSGNSIDCYSY